jgi:hypothetical protein
VVWYTSRRVLFTSCCLRCLGFLWALTHRDRLSRTTCARPWREHNDLHNWINRLGGSACHALR